MKNKALVFVFIAWLIALTACLGTLYASEIANLPVCILCWYQRIAIYPLVFILGIGVYCNDTACIRYALPFPLIGLMFALYQYAEQMIPGFSPIQLCSQGVACSDTHMKFAGFITLPFLSAIACLLILLLLLFAKRITNTSQQLGR